MSPALARGRMKSGPGSLQWIALFAVGAVIMGLTFTLGVLVGRQWSRTDPAIASIESGARKTVPPGKRGGLSGADLEPSPQVDQTLTFYRTLTAPLGRGSADASQRPQAKAQPAPEPPRAKPPPPPDPYTSRAETIIESSAPPEATTASAPAPADTAGLWSVQVAAFKTQGQADTLQKQLKRAGLDAYVASAAAPDGQTSYGARVGSSTS